MMIPPIYLFYIGVYKIMVDDDGFWEVAKDKFEDVKKRYELVREHKRWVSMRMKRSFLKEQGKLSATS